MNLFDKFMQWFGSLWFDLTQEKTNLQKFDCYQPIIVASDQTSFLIDDGELTIKNIGDEIKEVTFKKSSLQNSVSIQMRPGEVRSLTNLNIYEYGV